MALFGPALVMAKLVALPPPPVAAAVAIASWPFAVVATASALLTPWNGLKPISGLLPPVALAFAVAVPFAPLPVAVALENASASPARMPVLEPLPPALPPTAVALAAIGPRPVAVVMALALPPKVASFRLSPPLPPVP